jgi:hypothetical protein
MNPSFNPKPPLADIIKTRIANAYKHNILQSNATDSVVVRAISMKFGVGMDRVRAIIRLKELETSWTKEVRCPFFCVFWTLLIGKTGTDTADRVPERNAIPSGSQTTRYGQVARSRSSRAGANRERKESRRLRDG